MEVAYLSTTARGSSTACILCLENEHLHASNLGDSGGCQGPGGCVQRGVRRFRWANVSMAFLAGDIVPRFLGHGPACTVRMHTWEGRRGQELLSLLLPFCMDHLPGPPTDPSCVSPHFFAAAGFMVVRGGELVFMSPQQQHEFNFPYQIGSPDSMADTPHAAQVGDCSHSCCCCYCNSCTARLLLQLHWQAVVRMAWPGLACLGFMGRCLWIGLVYSLVPFSCSVSCPCCV